ncbi:MAG: ATP-binding protein [Candidatus Aminicenantes bacterium]|nr:ATP-binding protein [Candidatus Aminicenantes bacterium]
MYIKYVNISNFRCVKKAHIRFQKGTNILVGANNVGKSTVLSAIDMVLNPYITWWRRDTFTELDFYRLEKNNPIKIEILLGCCRLNCINEEKGNCPFFESIANKHSVVCKFTEEAILWNNQSEKFIKIDDINDDAINTENTVRLILEAEYQDNEGFVETKHAILNEDGEEKNRLTQSMREWIGAKLLTSGRNPALEGRVQQYTLLSKSIGNISEWKKICGDKFRESLTPIVKGLANDYATDIIDEINKRIKNVDRMNNFKIGIGIVGANENDIIRQIELSRKETILEGEKEVEIELPFSREGKGFQNIISLILGANAHKGSKGSIPGFSILMIEEPEQNLEPQLQRSLIKNIEQICGNDSQIILSTHSPYVISSILKMTAVQRLKKSNKDELLAIPLADITARKKNIFKLRKSVPFEMELLEGLFSSLVIIWEGECEAGFYQSLMRLEENFPSEMLAGIIAGGDNCINFSLWFKKAEYDVIVVLDGDKTDTLINLDSNKIPFIALPPNKKIEHIVEESFKNVDDKTASEGFISSIGVTGEINWQNKFSSEWPALAKIFEDEKREMEFVNTEIILERIEGSANLLNDNQMPNNLKTMLHKYKDRHIYEEIASFFFKHNVVHPISKKILQILKDLWFRTKELKQYQFNDNGELIEFIRE